ncbi:MAG: type II secretion system F family protein [Fibromonadaceae bacterium]|jgi:type IV pilus assembly protein PilC|nr:type II secretion system F family protein [Fibromonadaceae bacterium]
MPVYLYKAVSATGANFNGQLDAKDIDEARGMLIRRHLTIQSIKKKPTEIKLPTIGSGIKSKEIARFTRQFSAMSQAGLPIIQSLTILEEQTANPTLKNVIHKVIQSINGGSSLADALALHPKVFDRLYVHMVAAGEAGGILDGILLRLAEYQEANERLKRKVKKAMTYPAMVAIVAILVVIIMLTFVIPQFVSIFKDAGIALPWPTRAVMGASDLIRDNALIWVTAVIAFIVTFSYLLKLQKFRLVFDGLMLKAPMFGDLQTKSSVARFGRTLGTLLNAGVAITDALTVTAKTAGNTAVEKAIMYIQSSITGGKPIAEPMSEAISFKDERKKSLVNDFMGALPRIKIFPPMVIQMAAVGERTGGLGNMLIKVADFFDEEVDAAVDTLTSMIEPLIIVFLGGFIGFILVAMYMPMFSLSDAVG